MAISFKGAHFPKEIILIADASVVSELPEYCCGFYASLLWEVSS